MLVPSAELIRKRFRAVRRARGHGGGRSAGGMRKRHERRRGSAYAAESRLFSSSAREPRRRSRIALFGTAIKLGPEKRIAGGRQKARGSDAPACFRGITVLREISARKVSGHTRGTAFSLARPGQGASWRGGAEPAGAAQGQGGSTVLPRGTMTQQPRQVFRDGSAISAPASFRPSCRRRASSTTPKSPVEAVRGINPRPHRSFQSRKRLMEIRPEGWPGSCRLVDGDPSSSS